MTDTLNTTQAPNGAQTDETTVEPWEDFVDRQIAAQAAGDVPPALAVAARDLISEGSIPRSLLRAVSAKRSSLGALCALGNYLSP
jgi:hypothetical protein